MKRTKKEMKPDAILTGDWHLRETVPRARTDNYWNAQWKKIAFITNLQIKYQCPIIQSGDVFDHWKPSPYLLSTSIVNMPGNVNCIYGNHDLPQNNLQQSGKSGLSTLLLSNAVKIFPGTHWGQKEQYTSEIKEATIHVWHIMTWKGERPWPGCEDPSTQDILKEAKADLTVTGHNHKTFTDRLDGKLLVNPGSLMRSSADQIDHKPCVFLWSAKTNTVKKVFLPIEENVISREHLTSVKERDTRIEAFINKLKMGYETEVSYTKNLETFFSSNKIPSKVEKIVWECLEAI